MVIAFLRENPFHHVFRKGMPPIEGGEYNGYVAFDKELPQSWQSTADFRLNGTLDNLVDVHGGITYDNSMFDFENEPIIPLTEIPSPEVLKTFRCIGFDTLHAGDTAEKWTTDAVKAETLRLKEQIEKL